MQVLIAAAFWESALFGIDYDERADEAPTKSQNKQSNSNLEVSCDWFDNP